MIDTDKMKVALAATPLCQNNWTRKDGDKPTMLCAVSALVSFAGVQPDLIEKMVGQTWNGFSWFDRFAAPVLEAEYGIPRDVASEIPHIFDHQPNEWRGVTQVLERCERHNMDELHYEAIAEDCARFPQHTCAQPPKSMHATLQNIYNHNYLFFTKKSFSAYWADDLFEPPTQQVSKSLKMVQGNEPLGLLDTIAQQEEKLLYGPKHFEFVHKPYVPILTANEMTKASQEWLDKYVSLPGIL